MLVKFIILLVSTISILEPWEFLFEANSNHYQLSSDSYLSHLPFQYKVSENQKIFS